MILVHSIIFAVMLAGSVVLHEFGHLVMARAYRLKHTVKWEWQSLTHFGLNITVYKGTRHQTYNMLLAGVIAGALPVIGFTLTLGYPYIFGLPLYFAGCREDLSNMMKLLPAVK